MVHINFKAKLSSVPCIDTLHANHVLQLATWVEISRRDPVVTETVKLVFFVLSLIRTQSPKLLYVFSKISRNSYRVYTMKIFMGRMIHPPVVEVVLQLLYLAKKTLVTLYL